MDGELAPRAANLAAQLGLREVDAFYMALAARPGLPLATLNGHQRQRSAGVIDSGLF
jgi:predicted nucleic acid-binding protein